MIRTYKVEVTTTGSAGSATGNGQTERPVNGKLEAVYIDYTSQPGTCVVTLSTPNVPVKTLFTAPAGNTDRWFYPRQQSDGVTGSALTGIYEELPVNDYIKVAVTIGDAGSVTAYLLVDES